jgi:hypothetical protein
MAVDPAKILSAAVIRILRPLIRVLLRNGISYGTFADLAKWVFVDVAMKEFAIEGRKQSAARVSVITGLNRKEVKRVTAMPSPDDRPSAERYHRAARVVAGWRRDPGYTNAEGDPAVIPISGDGATFQSLVRRYSGDMPHRSVLDELVRAGLVTVIHGDRIQLLTRAYLPRGDDSIKIHILGADVGYLISTIGHNLQPDATGPFFQRKVLYDNLPDEVLPQFRRLSGKKSQALLERLDQWLSGHDRDSNPTVRGTGRNTAGIGIYYFEEPTAEKEED